MSDGGNAKISPTGFTDDVTIHQVGKTNGTASTQSTPVERHRPAVQLTTHGRPTSCASATARTVSTSTIANSSTDSVAP